MIEANKTYMGVILDNNDPDREGRVKVEVMGVFDGMTAEELPWANPWKDLNGNNVNIPDVGKIVTVVFENGDENSPEYIYADHYNINLENKLKKLEEDDYLSMKSIIFDHKTQIYVNDNEGLKIDYLYNNINLKDDSINLNLKDNNSYVNIGDNDADQQAILGNAFLDWMEDFLGTLVKGGLVNAGGPALGTPPLLQKYLEFKALKNLTFLSHHVNIVDNDRVSLDGKDERENEPQYGDKWTSNTMQNTSTSLSDEDYSPVSGPSDGYNQPVIEESDEEEIMDEPKLTFEPSHYKTLAARLYKAMKGLGTDEKAIWDVYGSLYTNADIIYLHNAFKIHDKKKSLNLDVWIYGDLNKKELKHLNNILKKKNISKRYKDKKGKIHI